MRDSRIRTVQSTPLIREHAVMLAHEERAGDEIRDVRLDSIVVLNPKRDGTALQIVERSTVRNGHIAARAIEGERLTELPSSPYWQRRYECGERPVIFISGEIMGDGARAFIEGPVAGKPLGRH